MFVYWSLQKSEIESFFTLETTWTDHASDYLLQKRRSVYFIQHVFFLFEYLFFRTNIYNSNTNNNENWFQALQNILYFVTRNYVTKSSTLIRLLILKSLKIKKQIFYVQISPSVCLRGIFYIYMGYKLCLVLHENIDILYILSALDIRNGSVKEIGQSYIVH